MAVAEEEAAEEILLFSTLSILQLIKDAQAQHGLRHGDYQRYAAYAARRIQRVRKSLKFSHHHKSVPNHTAKFNQKKVTAEVITDARYLLIPLFDAERAWATAMQLKQESTAEENTRKRHHSIARLRKAVRHANALDGFCNGLKAVDAPTRLEAGAYAAFMAGSLAFETQEWGKAMDSFTTAKTIYQKLAGVVSEAGKRELFEGRVAELGPQLRFCAYNIGDESAIEDLMAMRLKLGEDGGGGAIGGDLDKLVAATLEKQQAGSTTTVKWGGREVSLGTLGRVGAFGAAAAQLPKDLAATEDLQDRIALHDKLLGECREAIQAVRDEMAKGETSRLGGDGPLLHSYLTHQRLTLSNARYLLMVHQAKTSGKCRPSDLIRLYDSLVANLGEVAGLKEAPKETAKDTAQRSAYFNAFRCAAVAEAFAQAKKWPEAMCVFGRTAERIGEATKACGAKADFGLGLLAQLAADVKAAKQRAAAGALIAKSAKAGVGAFEKGSGEGSSEAYAKPLADDLESWRRWNVQEVTGKAGLSVPGALAPLPPPFQPMPGKPLFFDLALNHIAFPDLQDKCEAPTGKEGKTKGSEATTGEAAAAGGLGGVVSGVKGWFWGSK